MELTQALDNLKKDLLKKQSEVEILQLAISVLEDKFQPELTTFSNATAEIAEKQATINSQQETIAEKNAEISEKQAIIDAIPKEEAPIEEEIK